MAQFTLDDIREAAEKKYGSTDITIGTDVVKLINPLRLPKAKRKALVKVQDKLDEIKDDEDADEADVFRDAIRIVASTNGQAETLIDAIGDDLAMLAQVFSAYSEGTELGEASASAS